MIAKRSVFSFSQLLQISLLAVPFLLAVAIFLNDTDIVISWKGFLLISSVSVLLALLLRYIQSTAAFSIVATLSVYLLIFSFPRLIQLAAVPASTSIVKVFNISEPMFDNAITYLAIGTVAIVLGAVVGGRGVVKPKAIEYNFHFSHLIFAMLFVFANAIYWQLEGGATVLLTNSSFSMQQPLAAAASQLFSQHVAIIFLLISIILYKKPGWIIFVILATYAGVTVILGSRGASTSILLMVSMILAWRGAVDHFNVNISSVLLFFLTLGLIGVLTFPLGTEVRENYIKQRNSVGATSSSIVASPRPVVASPRPVVALAHAIEFDIWQVFDRLGASQDSLTLILNINPKEELAEKYLNVTYSLKSAVNILVPGVIFEDAKVNTSFMPRFIYEGADIRLLDGDYYESRPYTAWGYAFSHFGWLGGLLFLFVISAAISFFYSLTMTRFKGAWLPIIYLYSVTLPFFGMAGLDALIVDIVKALVQTSVFILVIKMVRTASFKFRSAING